MPYYTTHGFYALITMIYKMMKNLDYSLQLYLSVESFSALFPYTILCLLGEKSLNT